jgi:hypothetical protein
VGRLDQGRTRRRPALWRVLRRGRQAVGQRRRAWRAGGWEWCGGGWLGGWGTEESQYIVRVRMLQINGPVGLKSKWVSLFAELVQLKRLRTELILIILIIKGMRPNL